MPLAEDEDGRLDLDDHAGHLERRVVVILGEKAQELLVPGLLVFALLDRPPLSRA